jgi:hypothetical protein
MIIRAEQMDALRESATETYASRVAGELRQQFPTTLTGTTDSRLKQLVIEAIRRAKAYGVLSEADVKRYTEYMVEYGPNFDANPWARPILEDAKTGSEKMDDLDNYTTFELRS